MLADARPPALLALAPLALVPADARPPALLALAPLALVRADTVLLLLLCASRCVGLPAPQLPARSPLALFSGPLICFTWRLSRAGRSGHRESTVSGCFRIPLISGDKKCLLLGGAHGYMKNGSLAPLSLLCALILGKLFNALPGNWGASAFHLQSTVVRHTVFRNNS